MTEVVFVYHAVFSVPVTTLALAVSLAAHRMVLIALVIFAAMAGAAQAAADDRALKLYFTHTGERATIVFKRNGKFDPKGLAQINRFLRDWRRNEPTKMDPRLLDLVWEVYQRSGAKQPIHVVSAYRSPATNNMLRTRSRTTGVAKKSQHMLGKAMDFYIPGVKLATLRGLAMQMQVGGVGYYPTSGSPFVHLDVGNVRAWPRMSRQELARIFPSGRTLHLPADGRALPGYELALADQKKRNRPVAIETIRTPESDDDEGAPAPTRALVTAMLPVPQTRAERGLELQLARPTPRADNTDSNVPDLASLTVPLPTFRPALDETTTASVPAPAAPVLLATAVTGKGSAGQLLFALHAGGSLAGGAAKRPDMTAVAPREPQIVSAGVGAMSGKALVAWALQPPGMKIEMTAPRPSGMRLTTLEDVGPAMDSGTDEFAEDEFDEDRFALDG